MTKAQLIKRIAHGQSHLTERDISLSVHTILAHMTTWLAGSGKIEFRGFGIFSVRHRRARMARNSRTGTPVSVGVEYALHFKPAMRLRERVNEGFEPFAPDGFAEGGCFIWRCAAGGG